MNNTNMKLYLVITGILFGLIVLYVFSSSVIPKLLVTRSKAALTGKVDIAASYLLGGKITAKADGREGCIVNVFIRDKNDKGLSGNVVKLTGMNNITPTQALSDVNGMASFEMVSLEEGQFKITATVDGAPMTGKEVTVIFRN